MVARLSLQKVPKRLANGPFLGPKHGPTEVKVEKIIVNAYVYEVASKMLGISHAHTPPLCSTAAMSHGSQMRAPDLSDNGATEPHLDLQLEIKPFGKDGVRLCWRHCQTKAPVNIVRLVGNAWLQHIANVPPGEGVEIVRRLPDGLRPRDALWRLDCGGTHGESQGLPCRVARVLAPRCAPVEPVTDPEVALNMLLWYSVAVVDLRPQGPRIAESLVCPDLPTLAAMPLRDYALCIAVGPEALEVLRTRLHKAACPLTDTVLPQLQVSVPPSTLLLHSSSNTATSRTFLRHHFILPTVPWRPQNCSKEGGGDRRPPNDGGGCWRNGLSCRSLCFV